MAWKKIFFFLNEILIYQNVKLIFYHSYWCVRTEIVPLIESDISTLISLNKYTYTEAQIPASYSFLLSAESVNMDGHIKMLLQCFYWHYFEPRGWTFMFAYNLHVLMMMEGDEKELQGES